MNLSPFLGIPPTIQKTFCKELIELIDDAKLVAFESLTQVILLFL